MSKPLASLLCTVVGATTVWVSTAAAGPTRPAWCAVEGADALDGSNPRDAVKQKDPLWALNALVNNLCDPDDEGTQMYRELEAAQKKWSAKLDMTDADWKDAVDLALQPQSNRNTTGLTTFFESRSLSSLDPIEQWGWFDRSESIHYAADTLGPKLTEIGRMGYIEKCLRSSDVGEWAICQPDLLQFDWKKISSEVRTATKRRGFERMIIRLHALEVTDKVAERLKEVEALIARDPGYGKLFAIAAPIHKQWASDGYKASSYALAQQMDDARLSNSRKAFDGCDESTRKAFETAFGKLPANTYENVIEENGVKLWAQGAAEVALLDRDVYLTSVAYVTCSNRDRKGDMLAYALGDAMMHRPGLRGPRSESWFALVNSGVQPDDRTARIDFPSTTYSWFSVTRGSGDSWGRGRVGATKKKGDLTTITFAKELAQQDVCTKSKSTNKFLGWDTAGRPYYQEKCLSWKTETIDRANDPVDVAARWLTGIKKSAFIRVDNGMITAVFAKKGDKVPVAVFGVAVK